MSERGRPILSSVFHVALWAGVGAGLGAIFLSPQFEQKQHPSLSEPDATDQYRQDVAQCGVVWGNLELALIIGGYRSRKNDSPAPATPA